MLASDGKCVLLCSGTLAIMREAPLVDDVTTCVCVLLSSATLTIMRGAPLVDVVTIVVFFYPTGTIMKHLSWILRWLHCTSVCISNRSDRIITKEMSHLPQNIPKLFNKFSRITKVKSHVH